MADELFDSAKQLRMRERFASLAKQPSFSPLSEQGKVDDRLEKLMQPEACEQFCREYTLHINELRRARNAAFARYEAEQRKIDKDTRRIIEAIKEGLLNERLKDELEQITKREAELKLLMEEAAELPPAMHPSMANRYQEEVTKLIESLNDDNHRTEAATLLRKLIDKIVLKPDAEGDGLLIDLHGDLAGIMAMAAKSGKPLTRSDLSMLQEKLGKLPLGPSDTEVPKLVAGRDNPLKIIPAVESGENPGFAAEIKMVAGAGSNLHLLPEQVKMVAGTGIDHNLQSAPVKMVAGVRTHLYLLFQTAA